MCVCVCVCVCVYIITMITTSPNVLRHENFIHKRGSLKNTQQSRNSYKSTSET